MPWSASSPFGLSDALHKEFADRFPRRLHREHTGLRHDIVDDADFFTGLFENADDLVHRRAVAANHDGHGEAGPRERASVVQNRFRIAAIDPAGEQNHVGLKRFDFFDLSVGQFKRRRADDLGAGAEGGLIRRFHGEPGHVADHDDAETAGGTARSEHDLAVENTEILRDGVEQSMALMQVF